MPEFLELLPPADALEKLLYHLPPPDPESEIILTSAALGRVLADPVISPEPLPAFPRSTVDGFAVIAFDTFGASESLPAYFVMAGEVPMGQASNLTITSGLAASIHTGGMLPPGSDAVVMVEYTQKSRPGELEVVRPVGVGENILKVGEDVQAGQEVLSSGSLLGPAQIGGLSALGVTSIKVNKRPRIGIISSGDEVVPAGQTVQPGQVRDINSDSLKSLVFQEGGEGITYGIVPDQPDKMETTLQTALSECDMVVVTAGSSASIRDLTATVVNRLGSPGVLVHGVNVKPGKPTILGVCDGKPVIGLPGNPVSALVIARIFVLPVIRRLLGVKSGQIQSLIPARLLVNLPSQAGREDYIPVKLSRTPEGWTAEPIFYKSNLIFTLAHADGLARISADATGVAAGSLVDVELI